jgi:hypothetical protein
MGTHGIVERTIAGMTEHDPAGLRKALWDPEWLALGMEAFRHRLELKTRDATRLYFEALGAVSSERDAAIVALLAALKLRDMDMLRAYVELARQAEGVTLADARRTAVATLRGILRANPLERTALREELFGERAIVGDAENAASGTEGGPSPRLAGTTAGDSAVSALPSDSEKQGVSAASSCCDAEYGDGTVSWGADGEIAGA